MKLSIITVNYNNLEGLRRTINCVSSQSWRDFEWIIVDGGSTDGSKNLIEQIATNPDSNISWWCSESDKGIFNAMNKGIAHARGEYVNFLNSGDLYCSSDTLISIFGQGKTYQGDILYGNTNYVYTDHTVNRVYPDMISLEYFLGNQTINHQSVFIRLDWQKKYLYDEEHYRISGDYAFLMHCQFEGAKFEPLGLFVVDYDATGISQSQPFNAWSEAHCAIERELIKRYFSPTMQSLYQKDTQRGLYHRLLTWIAKIL